MRLSPYTFDVVHDSLLKASRSLNGVNYAYNVDRNDVRELRSIAEDVLNSLESLEYEEDGE